MKTVLPGLNEVELRRLYWDNKLNTYEISKLLKCSQGTIYKRMVLFEIPRRSSVTIISKTALRRLYLVEHQSSRKIAKIYKCAYSTIDRYIRRYGFPVKTLSAAHITTKRKDFNGSVLDKAYLIGLRIGDLRVRKIYKNSETIQIDSASTRMDMIYHVSKLFKPYGRVWLGNPTILNKVQVECSVNKSFEFLLPKYEAFPPWTIQNRRRFLSILAGFIDAEGCFSISGKDRGFFSLGNYNTRILKQISVLLDEFKIHYRYNLGSKAGYISKEGYVQKGDYWILQIDRKYDLYCFAKIILPYLRYSRKIDDVNRVLENINSRNLRYGYLKWPKHG